MLYTFAIKFTKIIINYKLEHVHMFAVAVNAHWNQHVHLSYQNVFSRETATKISLYRLNSDRKNKIEREKSVKKRIREQNKIYNFILTRVLLLTITTTRTNLHSIFQVTGPFRDLGTQVAVVFMFVFYHRMFPVLWRKLSVPLQFTLLQPILWQN